MEREVDKWFDLDNSTYNTCKCCGWKVKKVSVRKRIEHILGIGTGVVSCKFSTTKLDSKTIDMIRSQLNDMDGRLQAMQRKRQIAYEETKLDLPKRIRKSQTKLTEVIEVKDDMDMEYARMIVMSGSRKGFLECPWVSGFFQRRFDYARPSRRVFMRDLLPMLFKENKKQLKEICRFESSDRYCTITTDGWQAPDGQPLRNYMIVTEGFSFLHQKWL